MPTTEVNVSADQSVKAVLSLGRIELGSHRSSPRPSAWGSLTAPRALLLPQPTPFRQVVSLDDLGIGSLLTDRPPLVADALSAPGGEAVCRETQASPKKSPSKRRRRRCHTNKALASNASTASTVSRVSSIETTVLSNSEEDDALASSRFNLNGNCAPIVQCLATSPNKGKVTWSDLATDDFVAASPTSRSPSCGEFAGEGPAVAVLAGTSPVVSPQRSTRGEAPILSTASPINIRSFKSVCAADRVPASQEWGPLPGWGAHSRAAQTQDWVFTCGMHMQHMSTAEHMPDLHAGSSLALFPQQLQQAVMSASPIVSGKPEADQRDDALSSWLHASGLPSCTALEEQIRAAATETYED